MISRLCAVLEKLPWLRNRYYQMKKRMFLYYPHEEDTVRKKALFLCLKIWAVFMAGSIYFILTIHGGYEIVCLAVCIFYMAYKYILSRTMEREQRQLLEQLTVFLGELRFQYSYSRRIEEALEETLDRSDGMMYLHGKMIRDCLENEELEERYIKKAPVRFLAQLLVLCKSNFLYGDCEREGKSVFLRNVGMIKEGVEAELLKRKKIQYLFSGLLFTCMIPIGSIPLIELWAISNMEELKIYYYGTFGMITTLVLCVLALIFYEVIRHMQYDEPTVPVVSQWLQKIAGISFVDRFLSWQLNLNYKNTLEKHQNLKACGVRENVKQFLLLQYITAAVIFIVFSVGVLQYQYSSRRQIVIRAENMIQNIYQIDEDRKEEISGLIEQMVTGQMEPDFGALRLTSISQELQNTIINEIKKERDNWANWDYPWFLWLLPPAGAWMAYKLRYRLLLVKLRYTGLKREEEILTFQMVILCLMYADRITGEEIVSWLEKVAVYFRDSMEKVFYKLTYQNYDELLSVKEEERYIPMALLLEGIMACDRLPVNEAFFQMESDYGYTAEKYKQESSHYILDKSAVCKVLAFAPLYMTIGFKLIVPFVLEGLSQLAVYSKTMQQFM